MLGLPYRILYMNPPKRNYDGASILVLECLGGLGVLVFRHTGADN